MTRNSLIENFRQYITRHELFRADECVLLAISGGVDSMVLLSLFAASGYRFEVAHCNFELRGEESDGDTELVLAECARLNVVCHYRRFDTLGEMERTGESMEMTARRLRYAWFAELCAERGCVAVAVAHHTDDSIETFFINLLRGTGLRGLTGIHQQMGNVIRPLLFASRKDILDYATRNKIAYREDSSNHSTKYLRNKIRLVLIPKIREITPKFTAIMRGNLYRLTDAQQFIDAAIEGIRNEVVHREGLSDIIDVERINDRYPRDFVIYALLNSSYGFKGDVVEELCRSLKHGATDRRYYSRDYVAYLDRGRIFVEEIAEEDDCEVLVEETAIRSYCGNAVLYYDHTDIDNITDYNMPPEVALLDEAKLQYPLTLRRWREGDSFIPFGMAGRKKVGDYLTDRKMPIAERRRQFVLVSGEDIVWLVGLRTDERYRVTERTESILKITKERV